jgi:hypothetical protein
MRPVAHVTMNNAQQDALTHNKDALDVSECLCIPLSVLGKKSTETFLRRRRISGAVVFCVVRVISKERG